MACALLQINRLIKKIECNVMRRTPQCAVVDLLAGSLGFLASATASAQTTSAGVTNVPQVTIVAPQDANLRREEVTNKIVVRRGEFLRHDDNALTDVLRRLPGVSVDSGRVRMRGLGEGYVQILLDGTPVPPDFTIDSIAPDLIERIEILPTVVAEYSTRSIAGAINIVLRKSSNSLQRVLKLSGAKERDRWSPGATLLYSDKRESFSWSLAGTAARTDRVLPNLIVDRAADAQGRPTQHRETAERYDRQTTAYNIAPSLAWTLENMDTISWQSLVQVGDDNWTRERREQVLSGAPSEYPHNRWINVSKTSSARSDLAWLHYFDDHTTLNVKLGTTYFKRKANFDFIGFDSLDAFALDRNVVSDAIDSSYTSVVKFKALIADAHFLGLGWDGALTRRTEQRLQRDLGPSNALLGFIDEDYKADIGRLALFAQDEWQVSPKLQAYLGVRWEGLRTSVTGRTIAPLHSTVGVFSPIAQVLWKLPSLEQDQLRLALARTFNAPEPRRLVPRRYTVNNANGPTNPDLQGNPGLRPEVAWGVDAAYEHYFGKTSMFAATVYKRWIDEVVTESLFNTAGIWISMPVNSGKARTQGVTLDGRIALKELYKGEADIDLRANVTRNWSRVDAIPRPDNRLATQVPLSGSVGLEWRATPRFSTAIDFSYEGGSDSRVTPNASAARWLSRRLDISGEWKLDPQTKLRLSQSNPLSADQGNFSRYQDAFGSSSRLYVSPNRASVKLLFERRL